MKKNIILTLAVVAIVSMGTVATADAGIVTDFSNFSETGSLHPSLTLDQAFTPSGADIAITQAVAGSGIGQETFLSEEFTLAVGDRVSVDLASVIAAGDGDAGVAIASSKNITTRVNLLTWAYNGTQAMAVNFGAGANQAFTIAQPDTLFIEKTAGGWSFGTILNGTETLHLTNVSEVNGSAITANGDALGLWSDMRGDKPRTVSNLTVGAIPEPATMSLLALGGLGVLARRRRR
jgi:hypothetical protein